MKDNQQHSLTFQTNVSQNACTHEAVASEKQGQAVPRATNKQPSQLLLNVGLGQFVVVSEIPNAVMSEETTWSVAEVI